jgi:hypothetical protein
MSGVGKIARLPRWVRAGLNERLADGAPGPELVAWLNGRADVRKVLAKRFGGRTINKQNLTAWRQGGFKEWQRLEEAREMVADMVDGAEALERNAKATLADRVSTVAVMVLAKVLHAANGTPETAKEECERVCEASRELTRVRRANQQAERQRIETERWEQEKEDRRCEDTGKARAEAGNEALDPTKKLGAWQKQTADGKGQAESIANRDPKMREAAEGKKPSNAEKIALIRKAYFADVEAIKVELPV